MNGHSRSTEDPSGRREWRDQAQRGRLPPDGEQPSGRSAEKSRKRGRDISTSMLSNLGALVVVLDREGRIVRFNRACEQLTGYTSHEVKGRHVWDLLLVSEEVAPVMAVFEELRSGHFPNEYKNHWVTRDGRRRLMMWSNTILPDEHGGIEYVIGTGIDITEEEQTQQSLRKARDEFEQRVEERTAELAKADRRLRNEIEYRQRAEASLQASSKDWQDTFDAAQEAICVLDMNRTIVRCNQAMLRLLGKSRESVIGRPCCEVVHCTSHPPEDCLLVRLQVDPRRETTVVRRGDKWLRVITDPLVDETGKVTRIVHIMSDITQQKRAEEAEAELEAQRLLSLRADRLRSLGEMAAGVAHELNQPLVGVRGLAEHLLIGMDRGWNLSEEKLRNKLSLIVEQADRMSHIIERVRMFARDAGKPETRPVQVNDVVHGALSMLGPQLRTRGIALELELAEALPMVRVNPMSLEEVVLNLVVNAADALVETTEESVPSTALRILMRTRTSREDDQEGVQIQVIDEGAGIPEELLAKVFEPFLTTKGPDRGTGLGLAICKYIVEQVGGVIGIESAVGRGTSVTVSLPAASENRGGES